ncbi:MAG: Nif3-like dinuclear metal center hexameric protein [Clostridia bacterium]|nr:Nif3-like dinuclear metal center hexameric protein [Clostridia bacterium]
MKISEIEAFLNERFPRSLACEWDNDGLLVCPDREREVRLVITCLDVTLSVIHKAIESGAELILSHHPLLFHPLNRISEDDLAGQKILLLIRHGISVLSLHTRFDGAPGGLNEHFAKSLGVCVEEHVALLPEEPHIGDLGVLSERMMPEDLARHAAAVLDAPVRLYSAGGSVERVAVSCGSGKDLVEPALEAGADAFISGDIPYHAAQSAVERGMTVIDCGHHASENAAPDVFRRILQREFPELGVLALHEPLGGEIIG